MTSGGAEDFSIQKTTLYPQVETKQGAWAPHVAEAPKGGKPIAKLKGKAESWSSLQETPLLMPG